MRLLTGSQNTVQVTRNHAMPPAGVLRSTLEATVKSFWDQYVGQVTGDETPSDYYEQVRRSRQIWPVYGRDTGKYPDPIVSTIMDMMVAVTVAFGSENMLKDVPVDHPAKRVLDHWCATMNMGNPMLTCGLDSVRKQMHRGRWCDGGVVFGWSDLEGMSTYDGVSYLAPKYVAILPRTQFGVKSASTFGGYELEYKSLLTDVVSSATQEVSDQEKTGTLKDMLRDKRYQVWDRNRMETQKFPVPYLVERGLTAICTRIRTMQRGDYRTMARVLRALLVITQGAKEWIEELDWEPPDAMADLARLKSQIVDDDTGQANVVTGPYSTKAEWVMPDLGALLSNEKFAHDDYERLAALGVIEIQDTGQRRRYAFNPKPLIMEIWDAMQEDRRLIEGRLFPILWEANPDLFKGVSPANFHQKPVTIFMTEDEKQVLIKMFEYGVLTYGSLLEQAIGFGADIEAEANRHEHEQLQGYDDIFVPRVTFKQTVQQEGGERQEETPVVEAAKSRESLLDMYHSLKPEVARVLSADTSDERKKKALYYTVMSAVAAWGIDIQSRLRSYYSAQFDDITYSGELFEPYISRMGDELDAFGEALLGSDSPGSEKGLYALVGAEADLGDLVDTVFGAYVYRLSLYETEPFRVALAASEAAKASLQGRKYAVRHSAFAPTTCQECIDRHGQVMTVKQVFSGDWDHPHGLCSFTFHEGEAAAVLEAQEMLSIPEINSICTRMAEVGILGTE